MAQAIAAEILWAGAARRRTTAFEANFTAVRKQQKHVAGASATKLVRYAATVALQRVRPVIRVAEQNAAEREEHVVTV